MTKAKLYFTDTDSQEINDLEVPNLIITGISTLGITTITDLSLQNLNVSGISTLGITTVTNLTSQQLNVSGISTLGITTVTNLTSQQLNVSGISTILNGPLLVGTATSTGTASQPLQVTGGVYVSGSVGIGTTNSTAKLHLGAGTAAANTAPLKFIAGTNLTGIETGAVEYDGTSIYITPNRNFGRATVPTSVYTSGAGTPIAVASNETTPVALFPSANDTIVLPIGTYYITLLVKITRAASVTSAQLRINFGGGGGAVGTFSGTSISNVADGGASNIYWFNGVALTVNNLVTAAQATSSGVYNAVIQGILKITTGGTLSPQYSMNVDLAAGTGSTTVDSATTLVIQSIDTQSAANFGPVGCGWS